MLSFRKLLFILIIFNILFFAKYISFASEKTNLLTSLKEDWLSNIHGFFEGRAGVRTEADPYEKDESLDELRLQLDWEYMANWATFRWRGDFVADAILEEAYDDTREAYVLLFPFSFLDLKIGKQISTWGTGDMLFINDLFPKDWQSFFIGRDEEYLKAPGYAAKASLFFDWFNVNLVYIPRFEPDRFITGERISYWNHNLNQRSGRDNPVKALEPDDWFNEDEFAWRIYRNISGYELALYGYYGYWKSPGGMDPNLGKAIFPRLYVHGASIRGTLGPGIANAEIGYYDSRKDDKSGDNPFINNSQWRFLVGYEQEIATELTMGLQYYLEHISDFIAYQHSAPPGAPINKYNRQVLTLRLTKLLMQQNLKLSIFTYYSPNDKDTYLRPNISYKFSDHWSGDIGGNFFYGKNPYTFFGQFEKNNNIYASLRYSF